MVIVVAKSELHDWGKANYKPSDLGDPVRGKYARQVRESKRQAQHEISRKAAKKKKAE